MPDILSILKTQIKPEHLLANEPLKNHTTFKIGGPADLLVMPDNSQAAIFAIEACKKASVPFFIMGNGSNILAMDDGYRGVVIKIAGSMSEARISDGCRIEAESGILLSSLAQMAMEAGYSGMEFAAGIPGTLGGAVAMNAGAFDGEMQNIVSSVAVLTGTGEVQSVLGTEMGFGYRASRASTEGWTVLSAVLQLAAGEASAIKAKMKDFNSRRREKQPLDMPSAGSTFKRPEGLYAGKLIMDSGLKGYTIGGAQVSEKHCGFIINTGSATARDVLALVSHIQKTVKRCFNVELETEIKVLGALL